MIRHGMRYSKEYRVWSDMRKRCENKNSISFKWYGAKGISVCERWKSFPNFFADMGYCPSGMTIDRIDSSKNYEPGNCKWSTPQEQTENRACQETYVLDGVKQTLPSVCEKLGLKYRTVLSRMRRSGMSFEDAITHEKGKISDAGMQRLKAAVAASNIRRSTT